MKRKTMYVPYLFVKVKPKLTTTEFSVENQKCACNSSHTLPFRGWQKFEEFLIQRNGPLNK